MNKIIIQDNIEIDDLSKEYILLISNNSIRNLINILEKLYIMKEPIHIELCKQLCCNISFQLFEKYILLLKNNSSTDNTPPYKNLTDAIEILYNIHEYGYSVIDILDYFFTFIKTTELLNENEKYKIIPFLCKYITIFHNLHEDVIELALFTNNLYEFLHTHSDK
jgi:DNA polymerase III gamma/tau subunit